MSQTTNCDPSPGEETRVGVTPIIEPVSQAFVTAIGAALMQSRQLAPMLQECAAATCAYLPVDLTRIWLLNEAENQLDLWASAGLFTHLDGPFARIPVGNLLIGRVAQEQRPFFTNDLLAHVHPDNRAWVHREQITAFAGFPLVAAGRLLGVLALFARNPLGEPVTDALSAAVEAIARGVAYRRAEDALYASVQEFQYRFGQDQAPPPEPDSLATQLAARQQAEKALRVDRARLRALLGALPDLIFVFDRNGVYLDCLAGQDDELVIPRSEFAGESVYTVLPPSVADRIAAAIARVASQHTVERVEYELEIGGDLRHREARLALCSDDQVLMTVRDITERKKAELALRESEARFRHMADNAPVMIWVTDQSGACTYLNRRWCEFTGTELADNLGWGWLDCVHPDDRQHATAEFASAHARQAPVRLEYRLRRQDGEYGWALDSALPRFDEEGLYQGYIGSVIDISERRRWEEALAESNRRYRAIFETANAGIALTDGDGTILEVNEAFAQMLGYRPDDLVGVHFLTITHPDERADEIQYVQRARMDRGSASRPWFEKRYLHRDGSTVWVRLAVQLLRNDAGQPWLMTAVVQNITDVKQLETQLRQAQKMEAIGRLAGGLAHDFNNLLTVINGYSDLLVRQMHLADPMRPRVEQIRAAGERAAGLTRQLLAFSRRQVIAPTVFDLNVLVADLEKMLSRLVGEHIQVSAVLSPQPSPIKADPSQMEQVLLNLVANARDAMPDGGRLTITTANVQLHPQDINRYPSLATGPYVMLTVADTGHGMDAETQAHIFEPFFTTKGAGKGTGLGLATTYGIIQQNGGVIDLFSEVGRGAIFKVLLPATAEPLPQPAPATNGDRTQAANAETILLVEDDDQIRNLAYAALTATGYTVLPAANGEAALRVVTEHAGQIDLLVSDVVMPGMNGRQLSDHLLAMRPGLKVLFVSGYPAAELAPRGILAPGITLLPKPYTPDILQAKVREMLDQ